MITVLLIDDDPATRRGLRMRLALEPDIAVVGETGDGRAAESLVAALNPDVVVVDLLLPLRDGIAVTQALRATFPGAAVVVLSLHDAAANRTRAVEAGASAFVAKADGDASLLTAIRQAAAAIRSPG